MRDVTHFVVVFPERLLRAREAEQALLLNAMRSEYPHYRFDVFPGPAMGDEDAFDIIPVLGVAGGGEDCDPERVYMCKPLDPTVIPDLIKTLHVYEALGVSVN